MLCAHTGASMNPTMDRADLLEVMPYNGSPIRLGDVILFLPPMQTSWWSIVLFALVPKDMSPVGTIILVTIPGD